MFPDLFMPPRVTFAYRRVLVKPVWINYPVMSSSQRCSSTRFWMRVTIAVIYSAAGLAHLFLTDVLLSITPDWVPAPRAIILTTGYLEFVMVFALLTTPLQKWAGIAMAVYAICVWPVNFKHAFDAIDIPYISSSWWYHVPRLAMQPVISWWALFCSGNIDWPIAKASANSSNLDVDADD